MIECLFLVKNGVPFDTAFALPTVWRRAFSVALSDMETLRYDWRALGRDPGHHAFR